MKRHRFAIKSKHFSLYQAFKTEAEKIGWTYLESFNEFKPENAKGYLNCLFFSYEFEKAYGLPSFSLSCSTDQNIDTYWLETDFDKALQHARDTYSQEVRVSKGSVTASFDFSKERVNVDGKYYVIANLPVDQAKDLHKALGQLLELL